VEKGQVAELTDAPPGFDAATPRESARRWLARALGERGIPSAALDARVLLCAALGVDHAALVRDPDAPLGAGADLLAQFAARRFSREPVSRIIGYREFWGARFELGPQTLDPRADTETLIEAVLEHVGADVGRAWRLLDLGVGSGAILGALLMSLPEAYGVGVDISPAACAIARNNLAANGFAERGHIVCANWTAPLRGRFDIIVANPPYIRGGDVAGLAPEVRLYDPRLALDGGPDGLAAYRALIPAAAGLLEPQGVLALEFGLGQGEDVAALLQAASFGEFAFRLDLNGRQRIISARPA
jgi:release factor glutamine methyltransferase